MTISHKNKIVRIYIPLLNEGTSVVRPTDGEQIEDDIFRILSKDNTETEEWEFPPGILVRCIKEVWSGETILVAREVYVKPKTNTL